MLAISSERRQKKLEEFGLLETYAKKASAIFNVRPENFSKDIACEAVKQLREESPFSLFFEKEFAQINQFMEDFCNDKISSEQAMVLILGADEEISNQYEAYKSLGPLRIFIINHPTTES